eukprot:TRINITY_DN80436_c0_g1_i1.p1 TRINITY_DN80436_c0_g1~~TRINITY_DN80436_c0_g1_i1.p1  ORF type:complete len:1291 (+),score=213.09 TRINITY_DN80436_c0_g1_i1:425-3874(+)
MQAWQRWACLELARRFYERSGKVTLRDKVVPVACKTLADLLQCKDLDAPVSLCGLQLLQAAAPPTPFLHLCAANAGFSSLLQVLDSGSVKFSLPHLRVVAAVSDGYALWQTWRSTAQNGLALLALSQPQTEFEFRVTHLQHKLLLTATLSLISVAGDKETITKDTQESLWRLLEQSTDVESWNSLTSTLVVVLQVTGVVPYLRSHLWATICRLLLSFFRNLHFQLSQTGADNPAISATTNMLKLLLLLIPPASADFVTFLPQLPWQQIGVLAHLRTAPNVAHHAKVLLATLSRNEYVRESVLLAENAPVVGEAETAHKQILADEMQERGQIVRQYATAVAVSRYGPLRKVLEAERVSRSRIISEYLSYWLSVEVARLHLVEAQRRAGLLALEESARKSAGLTPADGSVWRSLDNLARQVVHEKRDTFQKELHGECSDLQLHGDLLRVEATEESERQWKIAAETRALYSLRTVEGVARFATWLIVCERVERENRQSLEESLLEQQRRMLAEVCDEEAMHTRWLAEELEMHKRFQLRVLDIEQRARAQELQLVRTSHEWARRVATRWELLRVTVEEGLERTAILNEEANGRTSTCGNVLQHWEVVARQSISRACDLSTNGLGVFSLTVVIVHEEEKARFEIEWQQHKRWGESIRSVWESHYKILLEVDELNIRRIVQGDWQGGLRILKQHQRTEFELLIEEEGYRDEVKGAETTSRSTLTKLALLLKEMHVRAGLAQQQHVERSLLAIERDEEQAREEEGARQVDWWFTVWRKVLLHEEVAWRQHVGRKFICQRQVLRLEYREATVREALWEESRTERCDIARQFAVELEELSREELSCRATSGLSYVHTSIRLLLCELQEERYRKMLRLEESVKRGVVFQPEASLQNQRQLQSLNKLAAQQHTAISTHEARLWFEIVSGFLLGAWLVLRKQLIAEEDLTWRYVDQLFTTTLPAEETKVSKPASLPGGRLPPLRKHPPAGSTYQRLSAVCRYLPLNKSNTEAILEAWGKAEAQPKNLGRQLAELESQHDRHVTHLQRKYAKLVPSGLSAPAEPGPLDDESMLLVYFVERSKQFHKQLQGMEELRPSKKTASNMKLSAQALSAKADRAVDASVVRRVPLPPNEQVLWKEFRPTTEKKHHTTTPTLPGILGAK